MPRTHKVVPFVYLLTSVLRKHISIYRIADIGEMYQYFSRIAMMARMGSRDLFSFPLSTMDDAPQLWASHKIQRMICSDPDWRQEQDPVNEKSFKKYPLATEEACTRIYKSFRTFLC